MLLLKILILAAMLHMNPLYKHPEENSIDRLNRMDSIAQDIAEIAMDPEEEPLFDGDNARFKTALFIASVANNESDYNAKVDSGKRFGDHGKAACLMQIHTMSEPYHYSRQYLFASRQNCIRAGLHMIRLHRCGSWVPGMMRSYVSGSCRRRSNTDSERIISRVAFSEVKGYISVMHYFDKKGIPEGLEYIDLDYSGKIVAY